MNLTIVALAYCAAGFTTHASAQTAPTLVQVEASRLADTAHLEFKGLKTWRYDVAKNGLRTTTITVPAFDQASAARLRAFADPLVKGVTVREDGPDGTFVISVEVAQDDVESFDYLTDEPSRLIIDFYRKSEPAAAKTQTADATPKSAPPAAPVAAKKKSAPKRKLASDEFPKIAVVPTDSAPESGVDIKTHQGLYDGGDENYDRFRIKDYEVREDAIIASRQGIYLPFPALGMKVSRLDDLVEQSPEYVIHPKDTRENKEARLLLALFERKRFAVFQKTYDYFLKKYPESEYTEILKNLRAQLYLDEWRESKKTPDFERAMAAYAELVERYPQSPLAERNALVLGYARLDRGEALATLQTFQNFIDTHPKSTEVPQARKAMAAAFLILRKNDEATAQLERIIADFPNTDHAREARYRLGDVTFAKGDYSPAIRAYESAIKDLPAQEKTYPNADFNMAEARFWQKDYRRALNDYIQFVTLYPAHEYGGYALTRIGEILSILGADQRRSMGAFLESYFRFPGHPGAKVARVRMLSQQMRGMKPSEVKKAMTEINDIAAQVQIEGMDEFATLMGAEGLTNRGEFTNAIDSLVTYYQKKPDHLTLFKPRVLRNISNELNDRVAKGEYLKALDFHAKFAKTWLKDEDRIDVPYFLGKAYEGAGDYAEAAEIYRDTLRRRERIVGTVEEKERRVREHLPTPASVHLRLAAVQAADREYLEAYQQLKAIDKNAALSPAETVERVELTAIIAEQRNEPERARAALTELARRWQGDPALLAPVNLKLAQTFLKLNDPKQAEVYADRVLSAERTDAEGDAKIKDQTLAAAFRAKGDAQVASGRAIAAIETYQRLLERFENKMPLASVRYQTGQILFDRGDLQGAADVWRRLDGTSGAFLGKVGRERLADAKWRDDYNKYINRIPAMADRKDAIKEKTKE